LRRPYGEKMSSSGLARLARAGVREGGTDILVCACLHYFQKYGTDRNVCATLELSKEVI